MTRALPSEYLITGQFDDPEDFGRRLERSLAAGPRVVQLRCKGMDDNECVKLADLAAPLCKRFSALLLLATSVELFRRHDVADGLHLSSDRLAGLDRRPIRDGKLLSVSCHDDNDLALADTLGADILLLSPIKPTSSHPGLPGLGWDGFRELTEQYQQPVYALGGMQPDDLDDARAAGAQGIAATGGYWI